MSETRITIYTSYTAIVRLADVQALAPSNDLDPLVEGIASILVDTFGEGLVGYTFSPDRLEIWATFKRRGDAERLALEWAEIVGIVKSSKNP